MDSSPTTRGASRYYALKGAPLNLAAIFYARMVGFASGIVIARVIGASEYGMFNVARTVLDSCSIVTPLGLNFALQRHLGSAPEQLSSRLRQLTFFRLITFVLAVIPPALVATGLGNYVEQLIYRYPDFANVLLVTLLALPFATDIAVLGGAYRGVLNPAPFILASYAVQPTVRLTILGLLFILGFRLWAVVVATSASYIISWMMLALLARKDMPGSSSPNRQDWADIRSVFASSPSLAASAVFSAWIQSADSLFLGHFGTSKDVGQYAAILMVAQLIGLLGEALGQTLAARIALYFRSNDLAAVENLLADNARRTALLSAPLFAVVFFWGNRIDLVLGPSFVVDFFVVALVAARIFLRTIFGHSGLALSMTGWHVRETVLLGCGLLFSLLICTILVPRYGQLGAALASFTTLVGIDLVRYAVVRTMFGIKIVGIPIATTTALAVTTSGLLYLLMSPFDDRTLSSTILQATVSFALYAGLAWPLLFTSEDRAVVSSLLAPLLRLRR
jgi:O-antigen/teichoic acid export membrane protein